MNINSLTTLAYIKASMAIDNIKAKIKEEVDSFNSDERGVEGFVVAIILIAIAAIFALVFREQIGKWVQAVIDRVNRIFTDDVNAKPKDATIPG